MAGHTTLLSEERFKELPYVIIDMECNTMIASRLGVSHMATKRWYETGEKLVEENEDKLEKISDFIPARIEKQMDKKALKEDFTLEFMEKEGITGDEIPPQKISLFNAEFQRFIGIQVLIELDKYTKKQLETVKLDENPTKDTNKKAFIRFYKLMELGAVAIDSVYLKIIQKRSSESKNCGLAAQRLKQRRREEFSETPQKIEVSGELNTNVVIKDIMQACRLINEASVSEDKEGS